MPQVQTLADFSFELPRELIAREPLPERSASRMLVVDPVSGRFADHLVRDLPNFLAPGDLAVFNNTRVLRARVFGRKTSGGAVELLIERIIDERHAVAQLGVSKKPKARSVMLLEDGSQVVVLGRDGAFFNLQLRPGKNWLHVLDKIGHIPLPPYLERADALEDRERYQTVYAKHDGSVAAPTAGLHFDDALLAALDARGVARAELTLHVGAGTFLPVRAASLDEHQMHSERIDVGSETVAAVQRCAASAGRVIAIGTTSARALESAAASGSLQPYVGETQIFIRPPYAFRVVQGLLTNFHLPQSTLLMLVSALAGRELVLSAYAHAISERYRFYSYGDAMLILPGSLP